MANKYNGIDFSRNMSIFLAKLKIKNLVIFLSILTAVSLFIATYFNLMPFSIYNSGFRFFIFYILAIWSILFFVLFAKNTMKGVSFKTNFKSIKVHYKLPLFLAIIFVIVFIGLTFFSSPVFISKDYKEILSVTEGGKFENEVENFNEMLIPIVDKAYAAKLGDKKLGEDNYGSQYTIDDYTTFYYNGDLYWAGVIEYSGFFKWINKNSEGSPGYVLISATKMDSVELVKSPLKYIPSAYFHQDLERKMYTSFPTKYRDGRINFELDDEGNPMFVQAVYENKFALVNGRNSIGVIIVDAESGKTNYYDNKEIPLWVDRVQPTEMIIDQINYWGNYVHGFFNTVFAKRDVLAATEGYNYVYNNDRLYFYSGVTSVGADESIVGVVLTDLRTKETDFYRIGGATEFAAQGAAEGKVQNYGYTASFPMLINFENKPTYFMTLKDSNGLIKNYAYVNIMNFNQVAVGETISSAQNNYRKLFANDQTIEFVEKEVLEINSAVVEGYTNYYFKFVGDEKIYSTRIDISEKLPFITKGDKIKVKINGEKIFAID